MPTMGDLDEKFLALVSKYNIWSRAAEIIVRIYSALAGAIILAIAVSEREVIPYLWLAFILALIVDIEIVQYGKAASRTAMLSFLDTHNNYNPKV